MVRVYYKEHCCSRCDSARSMTQKIIDSGVTILLFKKDGESSIHYPILTRGQDEYSGVDALAELAKIGGEYVGRD